MPGPIASRISTTAALFALAILPLLGPVAQA
jgi:hypothetical protein